jgi:hypothetical protein
MCLKVTQLLKCQLLKPGYLVVTLDDEESNDRTISPSSAL